MKTLRLECFADGELGTAPDHAVVHIDSRALKRLGALHEGAMNVNAYRISEFDYSVQFYESEDDSQPIRVDIPMLNVYASGEFSWTAVYHHGSTEFSTERTQLGDFYE